MRFTRVSVLLFAWIALCYLSGCDNRANTVGLSVSGSSESKQASFSKVVGLSIAGSDACYDAAAGVFEHYAKQEGWHVLKENSQYNKDQETLNIDSFIAKKVDAVVVVTTDIDTAGANTLKLNEAGIPVFYFMTLPNFPDGASPTAVVTTDWYMTGHLVGKYISHHQPNARCALIEGAYDQGMTELMRKGFLEGLTDNPVANAKAVINVSGSWMKPNAMAATEKLLQTPDAFDCIFTGNEEMMAGVIDILQQRDRLDQYALYSENGRQDVSGVHLRSGTMQASADAATTQEGDIVFQLVKAYFEGKQIPGHVYSPVKLLTKENVASSIPWDTMEYIDQKIAGRFSRNYQSLVVVDKPRAWSTDLNNYKNIYFYQ